jgi:hypothetical protein
MSCFGPFKRNDLVVHIDTTDFSKYEPDLHTQLSTRYLYGIVIDEENLRWRYNRIDPNDSPWFKKWKKEKLDFPTIRIPRYCWMNDQLTTAFIRLQGLSDEFGLDEN